MKNLSEKTRVVKNSGIRKMFNMAYGMKDIVSFSVGEPDFSAPQRVVEAANRCTSEGRTKYTPNGGLPELKAKFSQFLERNGNGKYDEKTEVMVTTGGMEALLLTMLTILDPGDEFIINEPCWSNYPEQVKLVGGVPVPVTVLEKDGFVFDPATLRAAITPKTKGFLLNSPSNPTGSVTSVELQKELAKIAIEHDLFVISDEVYRKFIYDESTPHHSIATLPGMRERTIIVDACSKTFAMTGFRLGFAAAPAEIIGNMTKLHESVTSCVNAAAQYGAIAALEGDEQELIDMKNTFDRRRQLMVNGLNAIEGLSCLMPKGAFYAFCNVTGTGMTSEEFAIGVLKEQGVVLVPGTAFGASGEGFVRLSYATSEANIEEGLKRIRRFVEAHR